MGTNANQNVSRPGRDVDATFIEEWVDGGIPKQLVHRGRGFLPDRLPIEGLADGRVVGVHAGLLLEAGQRLGALEARLRALPDPMMLLGALRKREIQRSSQIEQTVATIEELNLAEAGEEPPREREEEVRSVLNNLRALRMGLESSSPFGAFFLREMHAVLMDGQDKAQPGQFRQQQVYLGSKERGGFARARYVPPPPEHVIGLIDNLMGTVSSGSTSSVPWLVELAVAHYQFEAIHPFVDGNGRIGRLLVNIVPVRRGNTSLPIVNISEYLCDHRPEYYDALQGVSNRGDWGTWIGFFLRAVSDQAAADDARAAYLLRLRDTYYARFGSHASVLTHTLIDKLFERPYIRPARLAVSIGVTLTKLMRGVRALEKLNVVREWTGRKSHQLFVAEEILRATEKPLGELPPLQ